MSNVEVFEGAAAHETFHDDDNYGRDSHNLRLSGGQLNAHDAVTAEQEPHHLPAEPVKSFLAALDMMLTRNSLHDADSDDESDDGSESSALPQRLLDNGNEILLRTHDSALQSTTVTPSTSATLVASHTESYMWDYEEMAPKVVRKPWDCRGMIRVQIRHYLDSIISNGELGDFIIRDRKTEPGTLALQIKSGANSYNTQAIDVSTLDGHDQYSLRVTNAVQFISLHQLVRYYSKAGRKDLGYIQLRCDPAKLENETPHRRSHERVSMLRSIHVGLGGVQAAADEAEILKQTQNQQAPLTACSTPRYA